MRKYLYNYQTVVAFGNRINSHAILLRCQPCNNAFQSVEESHIVLPHHFWLRHSTDTYGNPILFGGTREAHDTLAYVSTGIVAVGDYHLPDNSPAPYYAFPTPLTAPDENIRKACPKLNGSTIEQAMTLCHTVNALVNYAPQSTDNRTTAAEVFCTGQGVCQDYAHLMLAFCHSAGLLARYANGFLEGEGETHAWVEVYDGYAWTGIDPTHNRLIECGYVKLAHGRDASDCSVNRGTYMGNTCSAQQTTTINVTLKEI